MTGMVSQIKNIIRKEFTDTVRDRRSFFAALTFAFMGPMLIYVLLSSLAKSTEEDTAIKAAIAGADQAPTLVAWLEEQDIDFTHFPDEQSARDAANNDLLSAVVISSDYKQDYLARRPAEIRIYADYKRRAARTDANRLDRLISIYGRQVATARMIAEGAPPGLNRAIAVETYDLSRAGGFSVQFSGTLTYMFLLAGFISGAFIAADSVAGERERHSLQPLLSQPVTPMALIIGKWIVAALMSIFVSSVTIIFGGYLLSIAPLAQLGLRFFTSPDTILLGAVAAMPLAACAAALQLMLAARAKSYREAATYAQYTMFLPIVIVGATQFANVEYSAIANYLPITGQDYALRELFLEGGAPILPIIISAVTTLGVAAVFIVLTARILGDEKSLS